MVILSLFSLSTYLRYFILINGQNRGKHELKREGKLTGKVVREETL